MHIVVVGASIAGLLAARVAADAARVTIVERDSLPAGASHRAGVPQGRHVHVLLMRGRSILERLLPGFDTDLAAGGSPAVDWVNDFAWRGPAGVVARRFPSTLQGRVGSRDLIEATIRRRVLRNVTVRERTDVVGLIAEGGRVTGVQIRPRQAEGLGSVEPLAADLVIDASGRGDTGWLHAAGFPAPREEVIDARLGYATREVRLAAPLDWTVRYLQIVPPHFLRGGVVMRLEGDRTIVSLAGTGGDYPPTDEDGFRAFADSLGDTAFSDVIATSTPLTPVLGYQRTENRRQHLRPVPGYLLIGDALCAFNPVYGQGMTMAAIEAEQIGRWLRSGRLADTAQIQRDLSRAADVPWLMATSEDFRVPGVSGGPPSRATRLLHRYFDRILIAASTNDRVRLTFAEVLHLQKPPAALFQPHIVVGALAVKRSAPYMPTPIRSAVLT